MHGSSMGQMRVPNLSLMEIICYLQAQKNPSLCSVHSSAVEKDPGPAVDANSVDWVASGRAGIHYCEGESFCRICVKYSVVF